MAMYKDFPNGFKLLLKAQIPAKADTEKQAQFLEKELKPRMWPFFKHAADWN